MEHLATIDGPRDPHGRRYSLPALVALCVRALDSVAHGTTLSQRRNGKVDVNHY